MKRLILPIAVVAMMAMTVTSCKCDEKKETEEVKTEHKEHNEEVEHHEIAKAIYQCPMKCEEAKTYDEPGQCPVCKMDLKEVEENVEKQEHKEDDDHDHGSETHEG